MTFGPILRFNNKGYSQIIYTYDNKTRYRIIKNPSKLTQLYYLTFLSKSDNNQIQVKLYPRDKNIVGLDE
jgi:hypothetical protein